MKRYERGEGEITEYEEGKVKGGISAPVYRCCLTGPGSHPVVLYEQTHRLRESSGIRGHTSPQCPELYTASCLLLCTTSCAFTCDMCYISLTLTLCRQTTTYGFTIMMPAYLFIVDILPVDTREVAVSHYFFSVVWSSTQPGGENRK